MSLYLIILALNCISILVLIYFYKKVNLNPLNSGQGSLLLGSFLLGILMSKVFPILLSGFYFHYFDTFSYVEIFVLAATLIAGFFSAIAVLYVFIRSAIKFFRLNEGFSFLGISSWLFRDDLDLTHKWWHKLLSAVFVILFIVYVVHNIVIYSKVDMFKGGRVQQWKKVEALSERITTEVKTVGELTKAGEKIEDKYRTRKLNDQSSTAYDSVLNDTYCSTKLYDHVENLKNLRMADTYYMNTDEDRRSTTPRLYEATKLPPGPFSDLSDYIKKNGINCLVVNTHTYRDGSIVTFLMPDISYQKNWFFYEKSSLKTFGYFIEMIGFILGIFIALFLSAMIVYYKIFLYLIYGNKKQ